MPEREVYLFAGLHCMLKGVTIRAIAWRKDEFSANSCGRIPWQEQARNSTNPNSGHAKISEKRPFFAKNDAFRAKKRAKSVV
jgi:hypothetical protein